MMENFRGVIERERNKNDKQMDVASPVITPSPASSKLRESHLKEVTTFVRRCHEVRSFGGKMSIPHLTNCVCVHMRIRT
ncbi:hypothetical protein POVWA2_004950 [Plasmodium ovale wallikeri]|uniref:Uncharacterized protein n=1 Tax=Plasmodium ovale wallikeri TaxID=864142 RepID=A0A1A8YHG9_PLAOA|nr:hypothetical protein POVWA1_004890 [Plasmodium ovale wallikeri]SBT31590.1 hypothetical protein POVWA2_004950 [Plasmodium ovale wallikeri]